MIEVRGLTKRYGGTTAVDDLSFVVPPGQVTGFIGPNGSGKSTTMRMITGLDRPTSGVAWVNGRRYVDLSWPLREVGALLDARAFHPGRSARDHLLALAQSNGIVGSRVDEVLDLVGLGAVAGRRAGTFSLGMGQRLGVAVALLGDPSVLLFDEPTNGLDPKGIRWARDLVRDLAAEGRTVLVSSHLINELAVSVDRIVVIGRGRLVAQTSVADLLAGSPGRDVRVRTPDEAGLRQALAPAHARVRRVDDGSLAVDGVDAKELAGMAAAGSVVLHELTVHEPSLEEAYFELTRDRVEYRGNDHQSALAGGDGARSHG